MTYSTLNNFPNFRGEPSDSGFYEQLVENQCSLKETTESIPLLTAVTKDLLPKYDKQYDLGSPTKKWNESYFFRIIADEQFLENTGKYSFNGMTDTGMGISDSKLSFFAQGYIPLSLGTNGARFSASNNEQIEITSTTPGAEASWTIGGDKDIFAVKNEEGIQRIAITETEIQLSLPLIANIPRERIAVSSLEDFEVALSRDAVFFLTLTEDLILETAPENWGQDGESILIILSIDSLGTLELASKATVEGRAPFILESTVTMNPGDTIQFIKMPNGLYVE